MVCYHHLEPLKGNRFELNPSFLDLYVPCPGHRGGACLWRQDLPQCERFGVWHFAQGQLGSALKNTCVSSAWTQNPLLVVLLSRVCGQEYADYALIQKRAVEFLADCFCPWSADVPHFRGATLCVHKYPACVYRCCNTDNTFQHRSPCRNRPGSQADLGPCVIIIR